MNGSMGRFRVPGMMGDINIEELMSRAPAAKKKAKLKELTGRMRGWKEKRAKTKAKSRTKAKPVVKAKAKPKKPTAPALDTSKAWKTPKQAVSKKIKKPPLTKYQKEKLKKFDEKFKGKKINPRPKPKIPTRPNMMGGRFGLMEDIGLPPIAKSRPKTKPKPKPKFETIAGFGLPHNPAIVSKPKVRPRPSPVKIPTRPKISSEDLMKVGSETKGRPNIPNFGMSGVIPGANINIEEIIKQAAQAPVVKPPVVKPPEETAQQKENIFSKIAAEANPENKSFLESAIDETKKKSESMSKEELFAIFEKMFGGQQSQEPMVLEKPQLPQVQQWNMMGPQQPTGPVVAAGPQQPSQFMPRPQIPSEMFGGYGGTAPIVPSMAYAGMGNFPQQPRMPRPRPEYDPDAQPGGPPPPSLAEIMGSMGSIFN